MPPLPKFTKDEILAAAFELIKSGGADALTARCLAARLGSSARPIFTLFSGMDEIRAAVINKAKGVYAEYVERGLGEKIAFKGVGMNYIRFARENPMLFKLLFMSEQNNIPKINNVLGIIEDSYERILRSVTDGYGLDRVNADRLYRHLWIYTHGIATLIATGVCEFTDDEASDMLTEVFKGVIIGVKAAR